MLELEDAVMRLVDTIRPRITRPNDITRITVTPREIEVELIERDDQGWPTGGVIIRRGRVRVLVMDGDDR